MVSCQITVVLVGGNRNSGVFRRFGVIWDSGVQPKGGSCKKIPPEKTRISRNPEESWQE
jgi:hypothetical protein